MLKTIRGLFIFSCGMFKLFLESVLLLCNSFQCSRGGSEQIVRLSKGKLMCCGEVGETVDSPVAVFWLRSRSLCVCVHVFVCVTMCRCQCHNFSETSMTGWLIFDSLTSQC